MTDKQFRAVIVAGFAALAGLVYFADQGNAWARIVLAVIFLPVFVWLFIAIAIGAIQAISRRRVRADVPRSAGIQLLSPEEDGQSVTFHFPEGGDAR